MLDHQAISKKISAGDFVRPKRLGRTRLIGFSSS